MRLVDDDAPQWNPAPFGGDLESLIIGVCDTQLQQDKTVSK
jgi:hypothetical protein